jgi:hypothetical protein
MEPGGIAVALMRKTWVKLAPGGGFPWNGCTSRVRRCRAIFWKNMGKNLDMLPVISRYA